MYNIFENNKKQIKYNSFRVEPSEYEIQEGESAYENQEGEIVTDFDNNKLIIKKQNLTRYQNEVNYWKEKLLIIYYNFNSFYYSPELTKFWSDFDFYVNNRDYGDYGLAEEVVNEKFRNIWYEFDNLEKIINNLDIHLQKQIRKIESSLYV